MVNLPPIKIVMTRVWLMTLFYRFTHISGDTVGDINRLYHGTCGIYMILMGDMIYGIYENIFSNMYQPHGIIWALFGGPKTLVLLKVMFS